MTFRTRLLVAFGVVVLVPLLVFGLGIRGGHLLTSCLYGRTFTLI